MNVMPPLYIGKNLRLTVLDIEKDAPVAANWSYAPEIAERLREGSGAPLTVSEVRRVFEGWLRQSDEGANHFVYAFRPRVDERLLGYLRIAPVQWVHGAGNFSLVIGAEEDRRYYAKEALSMVLNYAFDELNLFRLTVRVDDDDLDARELYQEANFYLEVRQRQAVYRAGQYLDRLFFGMLRPEWMAYRPVEVA